MREAAFDVIRAEERCKYSRQGNEEMIGTILHIPKFPKELFDKSNLDKKYTASCTSLFAKVSEKLITG